MRSLLYSFIFLFTISLGASALFAQTDFYVKIYAEDGGGWTDSVIIGKYVAATDDIGDSLSPVLVENELPPPAPGGSKQAADFRIVDPSGGGAYGQGVAVDIRHLVSDGQKDVYRLTFRRSDPEGSVVTLFWQSGLESVGGGGFYLTDGLGGFLFDPVDMHAETSFTHSSFNGLSGSFVDIVAGDGSRQRTFTLDSIGLATDYKGKYGKYEKRKNWATDFKFTLVVPGSTGDIPVGQRDGLELDLKKYSDATVSFPGDTTGRLPINLSMVKKTKPPLSFSPPLDSGQLVVVEGRAYKMKKPSEMKYRWFNAGDKDDKHKILLGDFDYNWQRLRMPNVNNLGEELYAVGTKLPLGIPVPVAVNAKGKPLTRYISHEKKWKDVHKTFLKKVHGVYELQDGPANCLDTLKGKEVKKAFKKLEPHKAIRYKTTSEYGNKLIGQLLALSFNIAISANGHTPAMGFGDLVFTMDGHPYNGMTVSEIAARGDSAISCVGGLLGGYTYSDFADFLDSLNREFSGPFDTISFGVKTVMTGIKPVAESDIFIGGGATYEPVPYYDYTSLYDAPEHYSLEQNSPNPFNPTTTIEFNLADDALVTIRVYNMLGQQVATLAEMEDFPSGENWVDFDATGLASGVYFYHMVAQDLEGGHNTFNRVRKMILVK